MRYRFVQLFLMSLGLLQTDYIGSMTAKPLLKSFFLNCANAIHVPTDEFHCLSFLSSPGETMSPIQHPALEERRYNIIEPGNRKSRKASQVQLQCVIDSFESKFGNEDD